MTGQIPIVPIVPFGTETDAPCTCDNCVDGCTCSGCSCQDCTCASCSHGA